MSAVNDFALKNRFLQAGDEFVGIYADMSLSVRDMGEYLRARLYLNLPKRGAKARASLLQLMSDKAQRYSAAVSECENPFVVQIDITGVDDRVSRLERYLIECDTYLRPYGRELGVLCARCRSEIVNIAPAYVDIDGFVLPTCPDCVAQPAKAHSDNRVTIAKRRARMGLLGALTGMMTTAIAWCLLSYLNFTVFYLAFGAGFLVDLIYRKFGGICDRWRVWYAAVFSSLGVLIGGIAYYVIAIYSRMPREALAELRITEIIAAACESQWLSVIAAVVGSLIAVRGIRRFR